MFTAQVTGRIARPFEKKQTKFGKASTFSIETKNKKGVTSFINCVHYGDVTEASNKGDLIYVAGDLDVSEYKGKPSISLLARNIEVLERGDTSKQAEEVMDEMPF